MIRREWLREILKSMRKTIKSTFIILLFLLSINENTLFAIRFLKLKMRMGIDTDGDGGDIIDGRMSYNIIIPIQWNGEAIPANMPSEFMRLYDMAMTIAKTVIIWLPQDLTIPIPH